MAPICRVMIFSMPIPDSALMVLSTVASSTCHLKRTTISLNIRFSCFSLLFSIKPPVVTTGGDERQYGGLFPLYPVGNKRHMWHFQQPDMVTGAALKLYSRDKRLPAGRPVDVCVLGQNQ